MVVWSWFNLNLTSLLFDLSGFTDARLQSTNKPAVSLIHLKATYAKYTRYLSIFTAQLMLPQLLSLIIPEHLGMRGLVDPSTVYSVILAVRVKVTIPWVRSPPYFYLFLFFHFFGNLTFYLILFLAGYSFFDSGEISLLSRVRRDSRAHVGQYFSHSGLVLRVNISVSDFIFLFNLCLGKLIPMAEY